MRVQRTFPPERASGHRAQEFVAQLLGGKRFDTIAARIVTSELVTNAVEHARTEATVTVWRADDHIRIEVSDADAGGALNLQRPPPESESGRGLLFVDELAREWGVELHHAGKTVWAVLDRPALAVSA